MSRDLTLADRREMYRQETGEEYTVLLTISHDSMAEVLRVTASAEAVISGGFTFEPYPFDIGLPNDEGDRPPRARLAIDNTDRRIAAAILPLSSAPVVDIAVVRVSAPDTIIASFPDFTIANISIDAGAITGDLTVEDFTSEPWPYATFTPATFPGVFI